MSVLMPAGLLVCATFAAPPQADRANATGLSETVNRFMDALRAGDRSRIGALLTDDVTWISSAGHLFGKDTLLASASPRTFTAETANIYPYGSAAVVVMVEKDSESERTSLDFWVRQQGAWRLAGRQSVMSHGKPSDEDKAPSVAPPPSRGPAADRDLILGDLKSSNDAITRRDSAAWSRLVTADYISISSEGNMKGAKDLAKEVEEGHMPIFPAFQDVSVRVHEDSAIVTTKSRPGDEHPEVAPDRVTRMYVKQNGRWLRAAAIVTKVAGKD